MRLITHNMLQCNVKNCNTDNFPLRLQNVELERTEVEPNAEFLNNMLTRLDWPALLKTADQLGFTGLPDSLPETLIGNDVLIKLLHSFLLETHVKSGSMFCNGCGHIYPIKDGIANMLLAEHEL
ncbi:hypothetical protein DSO57_1020565 [Entomophthora muscae]|uniref:Uncharacterized protein n=1 Tax=Entomophthora muscae TaxID=34485 RepID=A0ACC2T4L0_9FUNG|nr:hypothetical protein DSO57_1020565 [Entomophthora muscae]